MSLINDSIHNLKPSATLLINQKVKEMRSNGNTIYHFGFGQSPFPVPHQIIRKLIKNAGNNNYLPTAGLPELRKEIAVFLKKHQNIKSDEDNIFIGPGSKELLYQTILILNGTYLIPKGSWVSYLPQVNVNNRAYAILETYLKDDYKLQPDALEAFCKKNKPQNRILILNSPNNPTGAIYTPEELKRLATVCREYDLIVLSDEIYSQLAFNTPFATSISNFYPEKTIVFGGISKVFSAGGYRLGYMMLPETFKVLENSYRSLFSETFSAVSAPIQYAAVEAFKYKKRTRQYVTAAATILDAIATYVYERLTEANIECTTPRGGFYLVIDFTNYTQAFKKINITDSVSLAKYLLEHYNVALLPGTDFYFRPDEYVFRLAFVDFNGKKALKEYQKNKKMPLNLKFIETFAPNIVLGIQKIIDFTNSLK